MRPKKKERCVEGKKEEQAVRRTVPVARQPVPGRYGSTW
jgi:hypothetical protein